jgi:hypothetical protein
LGGRRRANNFGTSFSPQVDEHHFVPTGYRIVGPSGVKFFDANRDRRADRVATQAAEVPDRVGGDIFSVLANH